MEKLLPCPFCGQEPEIGLHNPKINGEYQIEIQCVSGNCPLKHVGGYGFTNEEAAIKDWNTRADGWISVEDRLPEKDGKYIIYYAGEVMMGSFYAGGGWYFNGVYHQQLTHWMPLPAPPDTGEGE